jgi:excisionase family DNA binding protein
VSSAGEQPGWRRRTGALAVHEDEVHQLPAVVDLVTAAGVLGIGRTTAYEMVRTGRWPTPVLRLGNRIRVPTAALRTLLSLSTDAPEPRTQVVTGR